MSRGRLVAHLRSPIHRNAYALVLTTLTTSGLGVVFWLIAARRYSAAEVGLNSALVAAMLLIASWAHLGMKNGLIRFVPESGVNAGALIKGAYALAMLVAGAAALALVIGLRSLVPELAEIGPAPTIVIWFTLATMAWVIFQLQDSVLTGLRRATWVLAENSAFSVMKICLLVVFASGSLRFGIFASWTLPLVMFVVVMNTLIFRGLIRSPDSTPAPKSVRTRDVAQLAGADFLGSLFWDAAVLGLPLVVLARLGPEANAHYYLAWSMAYALYIVVSNVGQSLVVEAVRDRHRVAELSRRALALAGGLVVGGATLMIVAGPKILRIFGDSYSQEGSAVLRLLAFSAVPYTINGIYLSLARVERRVKAILAVYAALSVSVLSLSFIWLGTYGITGVGMAWVAGQSLVASVLFVKGFWKLWLPALGAQIPNGLLKWRRTIRERTGNEAARDLAARLAENVQQVHWARTSHEVVVAGIGPRSGQASRVFRVARSEQAITSVEANSQALRELAADPRIGSWEELLPRVEVSGQIDGHPYTAESHLAGVSAADLLAAGHAPGGFLSKAARVITDLHQATTARVRVDAEHLALWLNQPAEVLARAIDGDGKARLRQLQVLIEDTLTGREVRAGRVHGDFTPGNVLLTPDGKRVTGVVDWGLSSALHLPEVDLWLLSLATRVSTERRELGDIVVELLGGKNPPAQIHPNDSLPWRPLLIACWLHHVAGNLTKSPTYARNRIWIARNVDSVLSIAGDPVILEPVVEPGAPRC